MNEINDIYEFRYGSRNGGIQYAGTLRNERKFNLHQNILFSIGDKLVRGSIIGIEVEQCDNPNYLYKVKIPEGIVDKEQVLRLGHGLNLEEKMILIRLICCYAALFKIICVHHLFFLYFIVYPH